jgi:hypothetical protein
MSDDKIECPSAAELKEWNTLIDRNYAKLKLKGAIKVR